MRVEVRLEYSGTSWDASARSKELGGVVAAVAETREAAIDEFRSALRFTSMGSARLVCRSLRLAAW